MKTLPIKSYLYLLLSLNCFWFSLCSAQSLKNDSTYYRTDNKDKWHFIKPVLLTGTVSSCNTKKSIFKGIYVNLLINDSISIGTAVDSTGKYTILTDSRTLANNKCKLDANQTFPVYKKAHTDCPSYPYQPYFGSEKLKIKLSNSDTIKNDLCLGHVNLCGFGGQEILLKGIP